MPGVFPFKRVSEPLRPRTLQREYFRCQRSSNSSVTVIDDRFGELFGAFSGVLVRCGQLHTSRMSSVSLGTSGLSSTEDFNCVDDTRLVGNYLIIQYLRCLVPRRVNLTNATLEIFTWLLRFTIGEPPLHFSSTLHGAHRDRVRGAPCRKLDDSVAVTRGR